MRNVDHHYLSLTSKNLDILSNNIFTPEKYSLKFLKEQVKAFAYYLFSSYLLKYGNWRNMRDWGIDPYGRIELSLL